MIDGDNGVPIDSCSRVGACELRRLKTEENDNRVTGGDTGGLLGTDEDEIVAVLDDDGVVRLAEETTLGGLLGTDGEDENIVAL